MRRADFKIGDDVRLYLGDCRDVFPSIRKGHSLVTDPPYGLGDKRTGGTWGAKAMYSVDARAWDRDVCQERIDAALALCPDAIVWGGQYYALRPSRCWLVWDKVPRLRTMADVEMAWTSFDRPSKAWRGDRSADGRKRHPTQKPVALMRWCLSFVRSRGVVFDPFMGSGSTGVAAVISGRRFIGVERVPAYFELAVERIRSAHYGGPLLEETIGSRTLFGGEADGDDTSL